MLSRSYNYRDESNNIPNPPQQARKNSEKPKIDSLVNIDPEFLVQSEQKKLKRKEKKKKLEKSSGYMVNQYFTIIYLGFEKRSPKSSKANG